MTWKTRFASKVEKLISDRLNVALNTLQLVLDGLGFVDVYGIGTVADLTNAGISFLRGNYVDAGINLVSAIPFGGNAAKLAKCGNSAAGLGAAALKSADEALGLMNMAGKSL
jgi:hypothetical protein